jgi:Fic family protein
VKIYGSLHQPPEPAFVADEVQDLCGYVNENWSKSAVHLAAYVLWKMNWIHPFADGNGRTARAVSYMVLSIKLDSLLPGTPTIPEQIAANKDPYYKALEEADKAWVGNKIDVSALETLLGDMLAKQLLNAAKGSCWREHAAFGITDSTLGWPVSNSLAASELGNYD